MTTSTTPLHGPDAQSAIHEAVRTLKDTGFWLPHHAHRDVVIRITQAGTTHITPHDGDRTLIIVDSGIEATISEESVDATCAIDILTGADSHVRYLATVRGRSSVTRLPHTEADASLHWVSYAQGENARSTTTTYLAGKGSDAKFSGCFLGTDTQEYAMSSTMIHAGDKSTSNMLTRAALLGASIGSADGLIRILPHAKGCDAYQRGEALLLSKDARMRAEPNLEIANPEVKCSHGVSLSRIDDDKLFYFLARGIPKSEAIILVVEGFFATIIDQFKDDAADLKTALAARIVQ